MHCSPEEKGDEVRQIPVPDACSNPRAMVVMDFNADSALRAVERPRWSKQVTGAAVAQFVLLVSRDHVACTVVKVFVVNHRKKFELSKVVEFVDRVFYAHVFEVLFKLLFSLVFDIVVSDAGRTLTIVIRNFSVHLN